MKSFLGKVPVVGQHVSEPFAPHHLHGDAVRQAICFIRPGFIEGKAIQEACPGLWDDRGVRMLQSRPHKTGRPGPQARIGSAITLQRHLYLT